MKLIKQNEDGSELSVYLENGYVVIESEQGEAHSYWLDKNELNKLSLELEHLKEDCYRNREENGRK